MQYSSLSTRNIFDLKKYLWVEINLTQISQCDQVSIKHESPKRPQKSLTVGAGRLLASCIQPRLVGSYWTKNMGFTAFWWQVWSTNGLKNNQ